MTLTRAVFVAVLLTFVLTVFWITRGAPLLAAVCAAAFGSNVVTWFWRRSVGL